MKSIKDTYTLNNGNKIPCVAFGTYIPFNQPQVQKQMIKDAIEVGYRYFDTASLYGSECALGEAIKESGIDRSEFFIATKVWIDEMNEVPEAIDRSLERLGTDYIDLYLSHWPKSPDDENWKETGKNCWKEMERAVERGLIKNIGLSNYLPHHIKNILECCEIKPVVDQLELHPGYSQYFAREYVIKNGMIPQAWSPLGRGNYDGSDEKNRDFFRMLANKYGKTVPQIFIRYQIQNGVIPVVKSKTVSRMQENMNVFDFAIEEDDMWMLECMPQNTGLGEHPDFSIPNMKSNKSTLKSIT